MRTRKAVTLLVLLPCLVFSFAGKKDKKDKKKKKKDRGEPTEQLVGWQPEGDAGACYHPPEWEEMVEGPRKMARAEALAGMVGQWRGERGDGVQMDPKVVTSVETVLFGDPEDVEAIATENLDWCRKHMKGEGGAGWASWLGTLRGRLTEGECKGSLLPLEMHDYLNLSSGWHMPQPFCKDDKVRITGSDQDYYRVDAKGAWINAAGDPEQKGEAGAPCESCQRGALLLRFVNYDGTIEDIQPVGTETVYRVPDHGTLTVRINDNSPADNAWKVEGGMQHHTGVTYQGAD